MGTLSVDKLMKTSTGAAEFTLPATDGTAGQVWQTDGSGQLSLANYTGPIATDAVGSSQIAANAVTTTEIVDDAVTIAKLAATGTASATTFLRGDNAWAVPTDTGKVLQLIMDTQNVQVDTTSTSYVATGMTITITPASTSSKFLLVLAGGSCHAASGEQMHTTFFVDGAEVSPAGPYEQIRNNGGTGLNQSHSAMCLHSPSTTSATTYAVYFKVNNGTGNWSTGTMQTEFYVMELSS